MQNVFQDSTEQQLAKLSHHLAKQSDQLAKLQQQGDEQEKQLEAKLLKQSEEQKNQLEAKLQQLSEVIIIFWCRYRSKMFRLL